MSLLHGNALFLSMFAKGEHNVIHVFHLFRVLCMCISAREAIEHGPIQQI